MESGWIHSGFPKLFDDGGGGEALDEFDEADFRAASEECLLLVLVNVGDVVVATLDVDVGLEGLDDFGASRLGEEDDCVHA